jgi:hypothetical protein
MATGNGENQVKVKALTVGGAGQRPFGIRNIGLIDFKEDRLTLEKMPVDMVLSNLFVTLEGHFTPAWDSGTPLPHSKGVMDALVEHFLFEASSKTVVKRSPEILRKIREIVNTRSPKAWHSVDSQTLDGADQDGFGFGDSGETIAVRETIAIPMALIHSITPELTYFDTSRHLQTNLGVKARSFANLVSGGNAVNFRITSHDLKLRVWAETSDEDLGRPFMTYRQDYTEEVFQGANKSKKIDIRRDSALMGIMLEMVAVDKTTDQIIPINILEAEGVQVEIKSNGTNERRALMSMAQIMEQNLLESDLIDAEPHLAYIKLAQNADHDSAEVASLFNSYELQVYLDGEKLDFTDYEYHLKVHFDEVLKL